MGIDALPSLLGRAKEVAPFGFAIAIDIQFTTPTLMFETYPLEWRKYYAENGLLMNDPTVAWAFENTGFRDWKELNTEGNNKVLEAASSFGLNHGISCATVFDEKRSMAGFGRTETAFSASEAKDLNSIFGDVVRLTSGHAVIPSEIASILKKNGVTIQQSSAAAS